MKHFYCCAFLLVPSLILLQAISIQVAAAIRFSSGSYRSIGGGYYYSSYRSYRSAVVVVYRPSYVYRPYNSYYYSSYRSVMDNRFRKSDYTLPDGVLERMGGLASPIKDQLLENGSVYVSSRLMSKFSPNGDYGFKYIMNTYQDIAVCQVSAGLDASFSRGNTVGDLSTNFSIVRNYSYILCPCDANSLEFNENDKFCCGSDTNQNCCNEELFYKYHGNRNVVSVTGGLLFVILIPLLMCCCCAGIAIGICQYVQRNRRRQAAVPRPYSQPPPTMMMALSGEMMQPMIPPSANPIDTSKADYPRQQAYDPAAQMAPPVQPGIYPSFAPPQPPAYPATGPV